MNCDDKKTVYAYIPAIAVIGLIICFPIFMTVLTHEKIERKSECKSYYAHKYCNEQGYDDAQFNFLVPNGFRCVTERGAIIGPVTYTEEEKAICEKAYYDENYNWRIKQ